MKKIEQVYREILFQAIEKRNMRLTQSQLAKSLNFSLSTINLAVTKLNEIGAVIIEQRGFRIIDIRKILYFWASVRSLNKDLLYSTRVDVPVREIERALPDVIYSAFSAYKLKFNDVPADYSEIYVYSNEETLKEIKKRFPEKKGNSNLFILKSDENLFSYGKSITIGQIFVDLWNLKEWYAKDFLDALIKKIDFMERK